MNHRFLTVREAAQLLHVHDDTIRRCIERGDLRHLRVGYGIRIPLEELTSYLARQKSIRRPPVRPRAGSLTP